MYGDAATHRRFRPLSSLSTGLRCRCPRCGEGKLFSGFLTVARQCDRCGLDFSFADPADGPAFFVMTAVGILVVAAWAWWAIADRPPIWLQMAVTFPAMLGGCLATLRPVKAWLVAEQFVHRAEEARWDSIGGHAEGGFVSDRRAAMRQRASS
jgi:uncharacterized protein (DUF983 family)